MPIRSRTNISWQEKWIRIWSRMRRSLQVPLDYLRLVTSGVLSAIKGTGPCWSISRPLALRDCRWFVGMEDALAAYVSSFECGAQGCKPRLGIWRRTFHGKVTLFIHLLPQQKQTAQPENANLESWPENPFAKLLMEDRLEISWKNSLAMLEHYLKVTKSYIH